MTATDVRPGVPPVPLNAVTCGDVIALCVTVKAPVLDPVFVGVNVNVTVQVASEARLAGQLLVCAKSPVTPMAEIARATAWLFVMETVFATLGPVPIA